MASSTTLSPSSTRGSAEALASFAAAPATPLADIPGIVAAARAAFGTGVTRPLSWRYAQLRGLRSLVTLHSEEIVESLRADMGRPRTEGYLAEVHAMLSEIDAALDNLASWVAERAVMTPPAMMPATTAVQFEPLGVVCVISPWNYPWCLALNSIVGAVAAGNAVVVKPSEVSLHSTAKLAELLPKYVDAAAVRIVLGGVPETTVLLKERFDHIVYTGSAGVGKVVMRAAAEHLTPVTLELGGKSPALVDATADLDAAARSIVWGRCLNAGQTCVSPDYVLVERAVELRLVDKLKAVLKASYGDDSRATPDFGRIISDGHFKRIKALLDGDHGGEVVAGGETDAASRFIAPTIIRNPRQDSALMRDEIFGPLLPVVGVDSLQQGVADWVSAREKPLALYVFSSSSMAQAWVLAHTSSGGVVVNDSVIHVAAPNLPFGGVGSSGMGAYHGQAGFEAMSHKKSVLRQSLWLNLFDVLRRPPYSELKLQRVLALLALVPRALPSPTLKDAALLCLAAAVAVLGAKVAGRF